MKLVSAKKQEEAPRESQPAPKPPVHPAQETDRRVQTAKDLRRMRARKLALKLAIGVVLPTVIAAVYYGAVDTPEYESVSSFTVQSADGAPSVGGLELLIASVPGSSATRDALLVQEYASSRDMLAHLSSEHGFAAHYAAEEIDWFSRLPGDASTETTYDYFREKVVVDFDSQSGVLTLSVRAFSPDKARELAAAMTTASERMVNEMMQTARNDRIALAQREVNGAESRLTKARESLRELQGERAQLNPVESASAIISVRSNLEGQLAEARAELSTLRATLQPDAPQLVAQRQRVGALTRQVERQNQRLAGRSDDGLNEDIARFEPAVAEKEFAEQAYQSAITSLEMARIEADRQHRYLVTISEPSHPDSATHPKVAVSVLTVFVLALGLLGIGGLLLASIREHANL